jgi:hypothetical protein
MKLTTLLQKHEDHQKAGLADAFGDGYLMTHNFVYRRVRQLALNAGYDFTQDLNQNYVAFPMGELKNLLLKKQIPYFNNTTALKNLEAQAPQKIEWQHVCDNLKPNYTFHEACHMIAQEFALQSGVESKLEEKNKILVMLISESFANTCEFMAIVDAQDTTHKIFLDRNSYFTRFDDRTNLKNYVEEVGFENAFRFFLLMYLHCNFLNDHAPQNQTMSKAEKSLAKNVFLLNPGFRFITTELYLRLNEVNTPVLDALQFDYQAQIKNHAALQLFINSLSNFMKEN